MRKIQYSFLSLCIITQLSILFTPTQLHPQSYTPHTLPYTLKEIKSYGVPHEKVGIFIHDVNHDGDDDLLIDRYDLGLLCLRIDSFSFYPIMDNEYYAEGVAKSVFDINNDGWPEFFIMTHPDDSCFIACYDWFSPHKSSKPKYIIGPFLADQHKYSNRAKGDLKLFCFDADGDGKKEFFVAVNNFYSGPVPRAVICFSAENGEKKWDFKLGPIINEVSLAKLKNGRRRILISSFATNNGAVWGGSADSLSYIFCLDPDGHLVWRKTIGGIHSWTYISVFDADGDGTDEIIASRFYGDRVKHEKKKWGEWSVAVINPEDGSIKKSVDFGDGVHCLFTYDLDWDNTKEIFLIGQDDRLIVLNSNLSIRWIREERTFHRVFSVVDLNNDGSKEIICKKSDSLVVLDSSGKTTASIPFNFPTIPLVKVANISGRNYLFAQSNKTIKLLLYEKAPPNKYLTLYKKRKTRSIWFFILGLMLGGVATTIGIFQLRRFNSEGKKEQDFNFNKHDELLKTMTAYGHSGTSTKIIDRLKFYIKNWSEIKRKDPEYEEKMRTLTNSFRDTLIPELSNISRLAKNCNLPEKLWEPLAKLPRKLSSSLELFSSPQNIVDDSVKEDILRLLNEIDGAICGIRTHLKTIFCINATSACNNVLTNWDAEFKKVSASVSLFRTSSETDRIFIQPLTFQKILDGLIDNALRATANTEKPEISIDIRFEASYCVIDITDNGCGIPGNKWEEIFDRHYTTKDEGGFGLYYAREELAKFSGKIFVKASEPGKGTTIRMMLRRC